MYVITGATGNIGSKLVANLLAQGQNVRAVGRSADRLKPLVEKGVEAAVGDLIDSEFLTRAFSGATGVFTLIPPQYAAKNFRAYQNEIGASIAESIRMSGVTRVVSLSSQGAELSDKTGPIKGLHDQEERLNKLENVNVLHARPTYFMENLLMFIPMIRNMNMAGSAIRGDLKFAMVATKDIAKFIAERLVKMDFSGKSVRDILGQRDVSLSEAIQIIGNKIGNPDLKYGQFSYDDAEKGMISSGLSEDVSRLFVEMSRALNDGLFSVNRIRTKDNTTGTSIEEFADTFAKIYTAG